MKSRPSLNSLMRKPKPPNKFFGWLSGEREHCKMAAIPLSRRKMEGPAVEAQHDDDGRMLRATTKLR